MKKFFDWFKKNPPFDFIFSLLSFVVLFIVVIMNSNVSYYDILFYDANKYEDVDILVETYIDAYSDKERFSITTGQNSLKVVESEDSKIYEKGRVKRFTYNNVFSFYAFADENMTEDNLKSIGVNETFETIVPPQIGEFSMQGGGAYRGTYTYIENDKVVYSSDIFKDIEKIHKNKLIHIGKLICGYFNYIFNGDGLFFLLTTCLGVVLVTIGGFILRVVTFLIIKLKRKYLESNNYSLWDKIKRVFIGKDDLDSLISFITICLTSCITLFLLLFDAYMLNHFSNLIYDFNLFSIVEIFGSAVINIFVIRAIIEIIRLSDGCFNDSEDGREKRALLVNLFSGFMTFFGMLIALLVACSS